MKILIIGDKKRYEKFKPANDIYTQSEKIFCALGTSDEDLLSAASDAEVILADAIAKVSGDLICRMPNLKMIHSEGVAFNGIDIQTAAQKGVFVCNNKGGNAGAVAEQTILLMLGVLRTILPGHEAVCRGNQIQRKESLMVSGITDLADCRVGLIGFGDIAKATALRLAAFGCECNYYSRQHKTAQEEMEYGVTYQPLDELLSTCDIISLHMAVNEGTINFMNRERFDKMKDGAYLINTSRGELVNNEALCEAVESGRLSGVGLDTIYPEPVQADNPVVKLAEKYPEKLLFSSHTGGITTGSFQRMQRHMWENVARIERGEKPDCIVNR